jgi:hypothetical protein
MRYGAEEGLTGRITVRDEAAQRRAPETEKIDWMERL